MNAFSKLIAKHPGWSCKLESRRTEDPEVPDQEGLQRITGLSSGRSALIVAVLCYINLLNYMDRFTVAGTDFWEKVRRGEGSGVLSGAASDGPS